ncbi:MAG TPA: ABC transporter permease [Vicinamibacterales bacterium]|nr:ABC transporter permease [Vicinamibacterales bacterium]
MIWRGLVARLRGLVRRNVVADEIRDEMQFHLAMRASEYEARGLSPDTARRLARRRFGNLAVMRDRGYDVRGGGMLETILQDLRYGVRALSARRAYTVVAVLTLAIAIGASTSLFSIIDAAVLHPLPFPHPEELVSIEVSAMTGTRRSDLSPSMPDVRAWRESASQIVAHVGMEHRAFVGQHVLDTSGEVARVSVRYVSDGALEVYGVTPALGRAITADDLRPGAVPAILLGHAYWQQRFGASPDVVGRTVRLDKAPAVIVGVLPAGFDTKMDVWRPFTSDSAENQQRGSGASVYARLRPGVTPDQAARALTPVAQRVDVGPGDRDVVVTVKSLYDETTAGQGATLTLLVAAVVLILVIACVNVAGLLVARGTARQTELAIRASIGASRMRLVRQLLTEALLLALVGGGVGVITAGLSLHAIVSILPLSLPDSASATLNVRVLAFALALCGVCAVLFGTWPAMRLSRASLTPSLSSAGRHHGSALSRRGGQVLIAIEVALAVVLLAGAGLVVTSLARLLHVDVGFDPHAVVTMEAEPLDPAPGVLRDFYPSLLSRVRQLPGVEAAGAVDMLPLGGTMSMTSVLVDRKPAMVTVTHVLPGFFEALGLRVIEGRPFADADRSTSTSVVVISERAARDLFPSGSALGRDMLVGGRQATPHRVIGVVGNVQNWVGPSRSEPAVYLAYGDPADPVSTLSTPLKIVVRTQSLTPALADGLRRAAESVGPRVFVDRIRPGTDWFDDRIVTEHHRTELIGLLGALGLLLALVGVASVTAYAVARRTREIGVRMTFGARPGQVVRTMMADAVRPVVVGLGAGLIGAFFATRVVASFLFETTVHDPATFAAVIATMIMSAGLAAWLPARRAARVDPVVALRAE